MKNYNQVYVKNSFEAAEMYCKAFGSEITREFKNKNSALSLFFKGRDDRPSSAIPFSYKIAFNFSVSSAITFLSILWNNISTSGSK